MIAEQTIKPAGRQVPIALTWLTIRRASIHAAGISIQVRIIDRNQLKFTNTQAYPVITLGHPNKVNVIGKPVGR